MVSVVYTHLSLSGEAVDLQAVPVAQAPSSSHPFPQQAVFALNEASGRLYAAGGAAPSTVHIWDMSQERCTSQACLQTLFCSDVLSDECSFRQMCGHDG